MLPEQPTGVSISTEKFGQAAAYAFRAGRTAETFIYMDGKPDRWVKTGDEVMFNENAEIFVLDRIKVRHRPLD